MCLSNCLQLLQAARPRGVTAAAAVHAAELNGAAVEQPCSTLSNANSEAQIISAATACSCMPTMQQPAASNFRSLTCGPISAAVGPWQLLHIATLLLPLNFAAGSSTSNSAVCVGRMLRVSSESGIMVADAPSCTRISLPRTSHTASAPSFAIVAASKIDMQARLAVAAAALRPTVRLLALSFMRAPTIVRTDGMQRPKQLSV